MTRVIILFILMMMVPAMAQTVTGTVARVADGDTLTVCDTGLSQIQQCHTIRVNGLNTPEKRVCKPGDFDMASCEPCRKGARLGVIAMGAARRMAPVGSSVSITVVNIDRYGRIVADVSLPDGRSWAAEMIDQGYGVSYPCPKGRCAARPRPWCPS